MPKDVKIYIEKPITDKSSIQPTGNAFNDKSEDEKDKKLAISAGLFFGILIGFVLGCVFSCYFPK